MIRPALFGNTRARLLHAPVLHLALQRHRLELSAEGREQRGARLDEAPFMILRGLDPARLVGPRARHAKRCSWLTAAPAA